MYGLPGVFPGLCLGVFVRCCVCRVVFGVFYFCKSLTWGFCFVGGCFGGFWVFIFITWCHLVLLPKCLRTLLHIEHTFP